MAERFTSGDSHPVITAGGIMPGGSEMYHWYDHVPFPSPTVLARKRAELLARIEEQKGEPESILTVLSGGLADEKRAA